MEKYRIKTIQDAEFYYFPQLFDSVKNDELFAELKNLDWKQEYLTFYGKKVAMPRLTRYFGTRPYVYSGLLNKPEKFPEVVSFILGSIYAKLVMNMCARHFNSVLLNFYRNGNDGIQYHSDDEQSLGENPAVASVSFGAERVFKVRNKKTKVETSLLLEHGSLLYMGNLSQILYEHCLLKTKTPCGERVNLTYRKIL